MREGGGETDTFPSATTSPTHILSSHHINRPYHHLEITKINNQESYTHTSSTFPHFTHSLLSHTFLPSIPHHSTHDFPQQPTSSTNFPFYQPTRHTVHHHHHQQKFLNCIPARRRKERKRAFFVASKSKARVRFRVCQGRAGQGRHFRARYFNKHAWICFLFVGLFVFVKEGEYLMPLRG